VSNLLAEPVALVSVQPRQPSMFFGSASRGGTVPGLAAKFFSAASPQSPAPDGPPFLLGKAAGTEGQHTAARQHGSGEILFLWSEHLPTTDKNFRNRRQLGTRCVCALATASSDQLSIWQVLRPRVGRRESVRMRNRKKVSRSHALQDRGDHLARVPNSRLRIPSGAGSRADV